VIDQIIREHTECAVAHGSLVRVHILNGYEDGAKRSTIIAIRAARKVQTLTEGLKEIRERYQAVFALRYSGTCESCGQPTGHGVISYYGGLLCPHCVSKGSI
jgi:hypothetical protein